MSLLFNMLSSSLIAFLPRSKHLLIHGYSHHLQWFWRPRNEVCHHFHCFPLYLLWRDETRCHDLGFLNVKFFFPFIFIRWRLITLQYCSGFSIHWHESAMDLHVFPIPIPPPTSLSILSLWVIPVHQPWELVLCIQPGLVICFTLDSILVSVLFSRNIPPSPSPTESQSLLCTSVSLFLFCILGYHYHLSKFHIYVLVYCIGLYLSGLLHSV